MLCIFCESDSSSSIKVEHIIPQSLGNLTHILPKGIVCDRCNEYFAIKIEKPLLEQAYFTSVRQRNLIESKKGRYPLADGIIVHPNGGKFKIDLNNNKSKKNDRTSEINIEDKNIWSLLASGTINRIYVTHHQEPEPNNIYLSRFLAKVSVEAMAQRVSHLENWNNDLINQAGLIELRRYARFGGNIKFWNYHQRRIHEEADIFKTDNLEFQKLHEYTFFAHNIRGSEQPDSHEMDLFFVIAIMGIEYTIHMSNPNGISIYTKWLESNDFKSPLNSDDEKLIKKGGFSPPL